MARSEPHDLVTDLLRLRRWAVEALSSRAEGSSPPIADIHPETWLLFLSLERCAGVLLDRLTRDRRMESLPSEGAGMLRTVAAEEAQSALRSRVDGRAIAAIASHAGFPVVVLKGGVRAISGSTPSLPVADIDLLVHRENVTDLVGAIRAAGLGEPARPLDHHQGLLPPQDGLAVEVHWTTHGDGQPLDPTVWSRLRPIESAPPLMQLGARDNVIHLIEHAVITHRERSISLRDTVLIGLSASECTVAELEQVRHAIAHNPQMTDLLAFAMAIQSREAVDDPYTGSCASFYSALALIGDKPVLQRSPGAMSFVTEIELARIPRSRSIRDLLRWRGTGMKPLASAADRFKGLGPLILAPAHLAYYSIVAALTLPAIRRTKRKALSSLTRRTALQSR
ncbi:MAG TPA: nucleotidyltransferase family protein [Gemmatimonadaceae bacterium]